MKKLLHPGNIVLFGFGGMVLFMCYLVYQCTQNPSIMVSKNYYEQELKYQDLIDAKSNTVEYSDSMTIAKTEGKVVFRIPLSLNNKLTGASVKLYNRADDTKDRTIDLKKNEEGLYALNTSDWGKGNYQLKLSIHAGEKQYYKEFIY